MQIFAQYPDPLPPGLKWQQCCVPGCTAYHQADKDAVRSHCDTHAKTHHFTRDVQDDLPVAELKEAA